MPQRIRAGCDHDPPYSQFLLFLCLSAFARVATCSMRKMLSISRRLCLSAFARVATSPASFVVSFPNTLPQRIRAGCDQTPPCWQGLKFCLCHSAFVRVATKTRGCRVVIVPLCHSAFVRVATCCLRVHPLNSSFATAHSCGLRQTGYSRQFTDEALPQRIRAGCDMPSHIPMMRPGTLPQRIRAGCDDYQTH